MEKIADVIRRKYPQFNTIKADKSINEALYQMNCENVDYLIVLDENERFIGILTEHDIASKVLSANKALDMVLVLEFLTTALPVATIEDSLEYALQLLENHNSKYLAVYDQFTFKGILTAQDVIKQALSIRQTMFAHAQQQQRQGYPWNY
jgi:predicted transcriptional regulator